MPEVLARLKKFTCPECRKEFQTEAELGEHIYVHEPPSISKQEAVEQAEDRRADFKARGRSGGRKVKRWTCGEHAFTTGSGYAWGIHKKHEHGGSDPRDLNLDPRPRGKPTSQRRTSMAETVMELKVKRKEKEYELEQINNAIKALEKLA